METTQAMPISAAEALELWDAGKPVLAFQVEAKPERQALVYAAAFDILRETRIEKLDALAKGCLPGLSDRESDVARSIAHVARESGWAKMVSQHVHSHSPAITVTKPKP